MKRVAILLFLIFAVFLLRSETMIVHTTSGSQSFDTSEIEQITFWDSTGTSEDFIEFLSKVPIQFLKNFPNPFNPVTNIQFDLTQAGKTKIEIYNVKGQKVETLLDQELDAGVHNVVWSGKDDNGKRVTSGIYFYKVTVNKQEKIRKMIMIK